MRVAIEAASLSLSSGGLARYTSELSLALGRCFPEDEFFLVSDQPFRMPSPTLKRNSPSRMGNILGSASFLSEPNCVSNERNHARYRPDSLRLLCPKYAAGYLVFLGAVPGDPFEYLRGGHRGRL